MTHSFKLSRRIARLRAPMAVACLLTFVGCNSTDTLNPNPSNPGDIAEPASVAGVGVVAADAPSLATTSNRAGIPIGLFAQPNSAFGAVVNGAMRNIWPEYLLSNLAAIKAKGGRVVLDLAGSQSLFKTNGKFDLSKWKARIDRFKNVNFTSYITDGTIIGHYVLDEPNDPTNWNGTIVSPATLEEMARYSKQLWPGMAAIVRAEPAYLNQYSGTYRYLDAAWAQYVTRKGTADAYLTKNVADAQKKGLALVVGLNISKGAGGAKMTASQVKTWGTAMLKSTYPCAFLSWTYSSDLLYTGAMKDAMLALRSQAQNRSSKSCRST